MIATARQVKRSTRKAVSRLPRPVPLNDLEQTYLQYILHILNYAHRDFAKIWPHIVTLGESRHDALRADDWTDEVNRLFDTLKITQERAKAVAKDLADNIFNGVNSRNRKNFLRQMHAVLGVNVLDIAKVEAVGKLFIKQNVSLITSVPRKYLDEVEGIVYRNFQSGRRAEDFQDDIEDRFAVAESRAALIARDQISKLNGNLTKERQTSIGIDGYYWRTSRDERVRDTHAVKEGVRFLWAEPPEDTGHPGEDYQCRCHADPDISAIFGDDE